MNRRSSFRLSCLAVMVMLGAAGPIDAQTLTAEGSFDRTLRVSGPVELDIKTGSGGIQVRTGPDASVRVIGRIRARDSWNGLSAAERVKRLETDPPIDQVGNTIRIGDVKEPALRDNATISYEITVPNDTRVRSRSGSGSQALDGVRGPVDATAGSGDIRIGQTGGEVHVSTGSGDIELERVNGALTARAGSGSIRALAVAGPINVRTSSGRIYVAQTSGGEVDVVASSGDITVTGAGAPLRIHASSGDIVVDGQPTGRWELGTSSGDVTLRLPANASFDFDARSNSGDIRSNHPVTVVSGNLARRRLQGQVRGGGARVDVTTSSGSIRVE
jgi:DUF4097 and DUF4098 domain-containing protein YvlB